jgi:hypothetical protein
VVLTLSCPSLSDTFWGFSPLAVVEKTWRDFYSDLSARSPMAQFHRHSAPTRGGQSRRRERRRWEEWNPTLSGEKQDYMVCPSQEWLDGIKTGSGLIRQFVAMPLGFSYTVEGQISGKEEFGESISSF